MICDDSSDKGTHVKLDSNILTLAVSNTETKVRPHGVCQLYQLHISNTVLLLIVGISWPGHLSNSLTHRSTQRNIEMDKLAVTGLKLDPHKRQTYPDTKIALYNNGVMMTDIEAFLYEQINGEKLKNYISKKFGWERDLMESITWDALGASMKSYTAFKKKKIIQLLYDWQNDGVQKMKFHNDTGECPACSCYKDNLHYLSCEDKRMIEKRKSCLQQLGKELLKVNTSPGIVAATKQIVQVGCKTAAMNLKEQNAYSDVLLLQAVQEQHKYVIRVTVHCQVGITITK